MPREVDQPKLRMSHPTPRVALQVGISWLGAVVGLLIVGVWPEAANSWLLLWIVGCLFVLWTEIERAGPRGWPRSRHLVVPLLLLGIAAWRIVMHIEQSVG